MRYGRTVEPGFLPVHSVETEEEAQALLVLVCPRNLNNEFIAPELVEGQTFENLEAFGQRLRDAERLIKERT